MALICTGSASQSTSATARCVHGKELVTDFFKPKQNWIDWEAGLLQQLLNCFELFKSHHYVLKKCAHYWQGIQLCQIPLQTTSLCTFVTPPSSTEFDLRCKECLGEASTVVWFLMVFLLFVISLIFRFALGNCHFIPHSKVPQRETIVTKFYLPHFSKRLDWRIHQRASQYLKCELGLTTDQGVSQDN